MSTPEEIEASRVRAMGLASEDGVRAAAWLGRSYELGEPPNLTEAEHWCRVAAEQRHRGAMARLGRLLHRGSDPEARRWLGLMADLGHDESRYLLGMNLVRDEPVDLDRARSVARGIQSRGNQRRLLSWITHRDWRRTAGPVFGTRRSTTPKPYQTLAGWLWSADVTIGGHTVPLSVEYQPGRPVAMGPPMWDELLDLGWLVVLLQEQQDGSTGLSHDRLLEVIFDPWDPRMDEIVESVRAWTESFAE